jgi:hypothetical protein
MRKPALLAILLALSCAAFAQCGGAVPAAWTATWQQAAFFALIISCLIISFLYMLGIGFNVPILVATARKDLMYMVLIAMLAGAIMVTDNIISQSLLPGFRDYSLINPLEARQEVLFCNYAAIGAQWSGLQQHTIDYAVCLREKITGYFRALMEINFALGFVSGINLVMRPLDLIGIGFSPGVGLRPLIDTLGYGLYMLAVTIAQLKAQEVFLCFAQNYMMPVIFPLGVALSALSVTRSAGGVLISLAIGFHLVLPVTYLLSEEIVQDYCTRHDDCDFGYLDVMSSFFGNARDAAQAMFDSDGQKAAELVSMLSLNGPFGPMIYMIAIASTLLPLCSLIVTLMFIKSMSTIFGGEVDFSAMIKIL